MKAAVTDGKGKVWVEDVPVPEVGPYQCLCRTLACATCTGTDTKHIFDKLPWEQKYPGLLGHESIGRVVECGPGVRNLAKGDLVLRPAAAYPGETHAGYTSMWGGFAEYGLVTDAAALKEACPDASPNPYTQFQLPVPEVAGVTPGDWTMIITLKECAGYVHTAGVGFDTSLLVLGAGAVGMSMCRHAKIFGAWPVIVVARRDEQLDYVRDVVGADFVINATRENVVERVREITAGAGVDRIIDTTGALEFAASCVPALNDAGRIAGYATYPRGSNLAEFVPAGRIVAARTGEVLTHQYLLDCVRLGLVKLSDFYSHVMPLEDIAHGFEMIWRKEAFKIVFTMGE
ncbi:MAG: zinc-binding dehydrogenase [Kiritimatiellaeota bacterium]|nr:zinc-binding dehydrogenase [Kiritimatiellota bacterium]